MQRVSHGTSRPTPGVRFEDEGASTRCADRDARSHGGVHRQPSGRAVRGAAVSGYLPRPGRGRSTARADGRWEPAHGGPRRRGGHPAARRRGSGLRDSPAGVVAGRCGRRVGGDRNGGAAGLLDRGDESSRRIRAARGPRRHGRLLPPVGSHLFEAGLPGELPRNGRDGRRGHRRRRGTDRDDARCRATLLPLVGTRGRPALDPRRHGHARDARPQGRASRADRGTARCVPRARMAGGRAIRVRRARRRRSAVGRSRRRPAERARPIPGCDRVRGQSGWQAGRLSGGRGRGVRHGVGGRHASLHGRGRCPTFRRPRSTGVPTGDDCC